MGSIVHGPIYLTRSPCELRLHSFFQVHKFIYGMQAEFLKQIESGFDGQFDLLSEHEKPTGQVDRIGT